MHTKIRVLTLTVILTEEQYPMLTEMSEETLRYHVHKGFLEPGCLYENNTTIDGREMTVSVTDILLRQGQ